MEIYDSNVEDRPVNSSVLDIVALKLRQVMSEIRRTLLYRIKGINRELFKDSFYQLYFGTESVKLPFHDRVYKTGEASYYIRILATLMLLFYGLADIHLMSGR